MNDLLSNSQSRYFEVYESWKSDPDGFWLDCAKDIDWVSPPEKAFDENLGAYGRWFPDATCNTCYNAVDRHVKNGRGDQAAIIYDSPVTGSKQTFTYSQLKIEVEALAATLKDHGIGKGDRVLVYMPMIAEATSAMLACARLGAVHTVVFGGFAAHELETRINDCTPKVIVAASCGIEPSRLVPYKPLLDLAIEGAAHKPEACLILQRDQLKCDLVAERDIDWQAAVNAHKTAGTRVPCETLKATDPLYILYTSGTTGQPKGVVRDNGGHMVALNWTMGAIYDVQAGDVYWAASDVGWVVGHSYIVYGPLLKGCTTIVFEGKPVGTPDPGTFWRMIEEYKISVLFTAPTAFRAIKKEDPEATYLPKYDTSTLKTLFLAGERADPDTIKWAQTHLQVPVIDHWWQTETAWTIAGNPVGMGALPVKLGSSTVAMPGYDIQVLDDEGHEVPAGTLGNITVKLPMAPGNFPTLWNAEDRFKKAYLDEFPGYYKTADAGIKDEDGYIFVMARTDDIINVAGHRLSTGAMEEVLAAHADVAECAVVGIADKLKGQSPLGLVVLIAGANRDEMELQKELVADVRNEIGPVAAFKNALIVKRLPKTRSGKILRGTVQKIADAVDWKMPATIDDPAILDEIEAALKQRSIGALCG